MARGKHGRRAQHKRSEREALKRAQTEARLKTEQQRLIGTLEQRGEIDVLVNEIEALRQQANDLCHDQEAQLRAEIRELFEELGRLAAQTLSNTDSQNALYSEMLWPRNGNPHSELLSEFLHEVEKRLAERWPQEYAAPELPPLILSTVSGPAMDKLSHEAIRRIQRARAK